MRPISTFEPLLAAILMAGCSSAPSESGGGFEGETVALNGVVLHAGARLPGAEVAFVDRSSSECLGRTRTGPDGSFHLGLKRFRAGFLETRSGDTTLGRELLESFQDRSIELQSPSARPWRGRLRLGGVFVAPTIFRVVGSAQSAPVDSDGALTVLRNGVGPDWAEIALADGIRRFVLLPPLVDSVVEVSEGKMVVLDDFEGTTAQSALGRIIGEGWWFANDDAGAGGHSSLLPGTIQSDFASAYTASGAYAGRSLSVQMSMNGSDPVHFAQVGIVLADTGAGRWMDLSRMDSLVFRCKGSGVVRVSFATSTSLQPTLDPAGLWGVDLVLASEWTRVVIRRGDIASPVGSRPALRGIGWSDDSRRCRNLLFSATSSATFQLDDIQIHGLGLADLVPP